MKTAKLMAALAITGMMAPSAMAAAQPAASSLSLAPVTSMGSGAQLGGASKGRNSKLHGSALTLGLIGAAAVGVGAAAAAGAFDSHHHHNSASQ